MNLSLSGELRGLLKTKNLVDECLQRRTRPSIKNRPSLYIAAYAADTTWEAR